MPKGMTPKDRKNVKNKKSIRKVASTLAGTMGMGAGKIKDLLKEAKMRKPSGRINMDDLFNADKYKMKMPKRAPMQKGPRKMPNPKDPGTRMNREPRKMPNPKTLGPLRPITERSKSKLTSRRRGMAEDFKRSRLGRPKGTRAK